MKIGTTPCNVTSLSRNQLTCRPTINLLPTTGSQLYEVVVQFGENLQYTIGKLRYGSLHNGEEKLSTFATIGEALGGGVLALIIIGVTTGLALISAIGFIAYRGVSTILLNSRNRRQHPEGQSSSNRNTTVIYMIL